MVVVTTPVISSVSVPLAITDLLPIFSSYFVLALILIFGDVKSPKVEEVT